MENYLFWDKSILFLRFVSNIAHLFAHLFFNAFGSFKIDVAYKRLAYKKRTDSNLIAHRDNKFSCKRSCEACVRTIYVKKYLDKFVPETKCQNCLLLLEEHGI